MSTDAVVGPAGPTISANSTGGNNATSQVSGAQDSGGAAPRVVGPALVAGMETLSVHDPENPGLNPEEHVWYFVKPSSIPVPRLHEPKDSYREIAGLRHLPTQIPVNEAEVGHDTETAFDCRDSWNQSHEDIIGAHRTRTLIATKELEDAKASTGLPMVPPTKFDASQAGIQAFSNHYQGKLPEQKGIVLYEYHMLNLPAEASRAKCRDNQDIFATDHRSKIISCKPLISNKHAPIGTEAEGAAVNDYTAGSRGQAPDIRPLDLRLVHKHDLDGLRRHVMGTNEDYDERGAAEALNIVVANAVSSKGKDHDVFQVGGNRFYYCPRREDLQDDKDEASTGIIAVRGYFSLIRPGMRSLLLNVNSITGLFYKPLSLPEYLDRLKKASSASDTVLRHKAEHHLGGLRVWVNFDRAGSDGNEEGVDSAARRTKTLCGICSTPKLQMEVSDSGPPFNV